MPGYPPGFHSEPSHLHTWGRHPILMDRWHSVRNTGAPLSVAAGEHHSPPLCWHCGNDAWRCAQHQRHSAGARLSQHWLPMDMWAGSGQGGVWMGRGRAIRWCLPYGSLFPLSPAQHQDKALIGLLFWRWIGLRPELNQLIPIDTKVCFVEACWRGQTRLPDRMPASRVEPTSDNNLKRAGQSLE